MKMLLLAAALASVPAVTLAQHAGHAALSNALAEPSHSKPAEGGQAAFSAIAEVVAALEADPTTDWSKVNIERLRRHLVDMDNAVLAADVRSTPIPGGARFVVTGTPPVATSVQRMAAGHAQTMNADPADGWTYAVRTIPNGVELDVAGKRPGDAARIVGLGFAGLLARGNHHRAHHFAMASGKSAH